MQPNYFLEAEYQDGYIHSELKLRDVSPYTDKANIFSDILNKRPVPEHGKMVRFSLIGAERRFDIDWSEFPEEAKPIRFIHKSLVQDQVTTVNPDGSGLSWEDVGDPRVVIDSYDFGYEYWDENGKKQKAVKTVTE